MRVPHPHPGLRAVGVVHLIVSALGVLGWLAVSYLVAFCGDGVDRTDAPKCYTVRSHWWMPTVATAVSGLVAVLVVLRARRADTALERWLLVAAALVSAVVMIVVLRWYSGRADAAVPAA